MWFHPFLQLFELICVQSMINIEIFDRRIILTGPNDMLRLSVIITT